MLSEASYRAVVCEALGPPESLRLRSLPRIALAPGSVRVALRAAGINFPDALMIEGRYQHRPQIPFVPGLEAAGVVIEAAADVEGGDVGARVIVRMQGGGYAEEAVVPASALVPLPRGFSFAEGATFLAAHITAYHALQTRARLAAGQSLLVLGAGGGVGLAAVQIGRVLGARVFAAASSETKLELARRHGAAHAINYVEEPIDAAVRRLTAGKGVDAVFDPVGIDAPSAVRCLRWNGTLLIVGFAGGSIPAFAANRLLLKGSSVLGVRAGEAGRRDPALRRDELRALLGLAADDRVRPVVSETFPLEAYAEAMRRVTARRALGRLAFVMQPQGGPARGAPQDLHAASPG